jgi:two-component system, NtrC family, nitrogen regulation sensor histidine kinase NtrY
LPNPRGRAYCPTLRFCFLLMLPSSHSSPDAAPRAGSPLQAAWAFGIYLLLLLSVVGSAVLAHRAAYDSSTFFDFDNLLRLSQSGASWLLLLGCLPVGLFLFFQMGSQAVQRMALPITWRGGALLLATFVAFGVGAFLPGSEGVNLGLVLGFGLVVTALFDFLTDRSAPGFGWTVLALMLFSAFFASLMFDFSQKRDATIRSEYATALASVRDTATAEAHLQRLHTRIQNDPALPELLQPWPFKPSTDTLRNHFNRLVYAENYLFQHYRLQVYAFDRDEESPLLLDQREGRSSVLAQWNQAIPIGEGVRSTFAPDGTHRYLLHVRANRMGDASHPAELFFAFDRSYPEPTQVYAQLFYNQPFKQLTRLGQYDFAVLHDGRLVAEQGRVNPVAYALAVPNGTTRELTADTRLDAVSKAADGRTQAVVGRPATSWVKGMYLFSILFTLATLLLFVLGGLLRVLPRTLTFLPTTRGSLARRIHFSNLSLIAVGFLLLGYLTYRHFEQTEVAKARTEADYRAEVLRTNLRLAGSNLSVQADTIQRVLGPALSRVATSLAVDANLYDGDGRLLYTTRDDLRRIGILTPKMNPTARTALANSTADATDVAEKINDNSFNTKYLTLRNRQNELLGYVAMPYRADGGRVAPEVSDFLGMLASIYVFLLLAAVAATYVLARSITRPVNQIADKIKELQLENKNQPLEYRGDATDELGALVGSYNRMVDQLEDSKMQLVKLEREAAWREMARQIAHDIKNPLTTMKLSMQQLERVSSDPAQAAAYLKRATGRLIEQIDSLAQTASEFSMFAQLDINQRADTVLNDIVESVYDLFTEQHEAILHLELPKENFHIRADKNHLLRVFNNLVINAIQAIPSDREGRVQVSLRREGRHAVVRISDNGGGIPAEIRDRVFEPNFTTKTTGSGLGLAICKKIIEAHDGSIRFETRDDEGTDFFVELPIVEQS